MGVAPLVYDRRVRVVQGLAGILSMAVGLVPLAAPEHVHEREHHGHADVVVHRHAEPHGLGHHDDHAPQSSLDDDESRVLTLTIFYTVPNSVTLAAPERSMTELIDAPELQSVKALLSKFDVPIHGPPRAPAGLRAPPFSPAS